MIVKLESQAKYRRIPLICRWKLSPLINQHIKNVRIDTFNLLGAFNTFKLGFFSDNLAGFDAISA